MTLPSFSLYLNTNINILVADAVWASNYWAKRRKEEKNLERVSSSVRTNSSEDQHHNNHDKSFHYYNILLLLEIQETIGVTRCFVLFSLQLPTYCQGSCYYYWWYTVCNKNLISAKKSTDRWIQRENIIQKFCSWSWLENCVLLTQFHCNICFQFKLTVYR